MMNYFRRPALAGFNLPHTEYATVRGARRRRDADGTSATPYFAGLAAGDTLEVQVQGTDYTVTFSDESLSAVLADINAVLGSAGRAYDDWGCLALKSNTQGHASYVAVKGGTGAEALGFDLVSHSAVAARGGDIPSSSEGLGAGNWQGVVFPRRGDGLSIDAFSRTAARLAANLDVLHASLVRPAARLQKVASIGGTGQTTWTPNSEQAPTRIYNGYGLIGPLSAAQVLAPYFLVLDAQTGRRAPSRVVGLTRGVPAGAPPYANAPDFADTSGKNVLGQDLVKVAPVAIDEVRENRVVVCPGALFLTKKTRVGDWAEIAGATNTRPFSHNGYRWAVEAVLSETALALRPLSKSELQLAGVSVDDVQPVTELNGARPTGSVYGNLTVRTGPFTSDVTFVFDVPLSPGGSYELWACQPVSQLEARPWQEQESHFLPYREMGGDESLADGPLSGLGVSLAGGTVTVAAGEVRWNSRAWGVPSRTFTFADVGANQTRALVWDASDFQLKLVASGALGTSHHALATLVSDATSITSVMAHVRRHAEGPLHVTVGARGQFPTLDAAFAWLNLHAAAAPAEVLLLDAGMVLPARLLTARHVRLRGFSTNVSLAIPAGATLRFAGAAGELCSLVLEDLQLTAVPGASMAPLLTVEGGQVDVFLRNVRTAAPYNASCDLVVQTTGGAMLRSLNLEGCSLMLRKGVVAAETLLQARFNIEGCTLSGDAVNTPVVGALLFANAAGTGAPAATAVSLGRCYLEGWSTPVLHATHVEGNYFGHPLTVASRPSGSSLHFASNRVTGAFLMAAHSAARASLVGNIFEAAATVGPCLFAHNDVVGAMTVQRSSDSPAIKAALQAEGCHFRAAFTLNGEARFSNCHFDGAFNNNLALESVSFQGCRFAGTLDLQAEAVDSLVLEGCELLEAATLGSDGTVMAGGLLRAGISQNLFHKDVSVGVRTGGAARIVGNQQLPAAGFNFFRMHGQSVTARFVFSDNHLDIWHLNGKVGDFYLSNNFVTCGSRAAFECRTALGEVKATFGGNTFMGGCRVSGADRCHATANHFEDDATGLDIENTHHVKVVGNTILGTDAVIPGGGVPFQRPLIIRSQAINYGGGGVQRDCDNVVVESNHIAQTGTYAGYFPVHLGNLRFFQFKNNFLARPNGTNWGGATVEVAELSACNYGMVGGNTTWVNSTSQAGIIVVTNSPAGERVYWSQDPTDTKPTSDGSAQCFIEL